MQLRSRAILLSFLICVIPTSASTIGYDAILAIVIAELIFAFSVGVVCIVFSFNLFRTLKHSHEDNDLSRGDIPSRHFTSGGNIKNSSQNNLVNGVTDPNDYSTYQERETYSFGSEAELDFEGRIDGAATGGDERDSEGNGMVAVFTTFASYLRPW